MISRQQQYNGKLANRLGASTVRQKRSDDKLLEVSDGRLNDVCLVDQDCKLHPVVYCNKAKSIVGIGGTCKLTWWFMLSLVAAALIILGVAITCLCAPCCCLYECGKKLLCCCN